MMILPQRRNGYLATWCNSVVDTLWRMRVLSSQDVAVDELPDGVRLRVNWRAQAAALSDDKATFRCVQTSATKVMVYAGCIRHHGFSATWTADTEITLSGAEYVWLYVNQTRDTLTASIMQSTDEPTSDTNAIRVPLTKWHRIGTEESPSYELALTAHKHDIQFANPLT